MSGLERTLSAGGTDRTSEAKKFMWLKKFLVSRGADQKVLDRLNGAKALRKYGLENGYLQTGDEPDEPAGPEEPEDPEQLAREQEIAAKMQADLARIAASDLSSAYLEEIAADPNLQGITTKAALHARLRELSAPLTAQDPDGSVWKQLTFSGAHPYPRFRAHNIWRHKGIGAGIKSITEYYRYAIKDEATVRFAMELLSAGAPSEILAAANGLGGVFHGGSKCLTDRKELAKNDIKLIVQTAYGMDFCIRNYKGVKQGLEESGIQVLELNWQDAEEQVLVEDQLVGALEAMEMTRTAGHGVLVNCMQGKSRSASVVVAYIAAKDNMKIDKALALVKRQRQTAQPNNSFMAQLKEYEKAGLFKRLNSHF